MSVYEIGNLFVTVEGDYTPAPGGYAAPFAREWGSEDCPPTARLSVRLAWGDVAALAACPQPEGIHCRRDGLNGLRSTPQGLALLSTVGRAGYALASFPERIRETGDVDILVDPRIAEEPPLPIGNLLARVGLHRALLTRDRPVVHAAYVDISRMDISTSGISHLGIDSPDEPGCILFMAPSGVGKSTQAALWEEYGGGEIINGDRALLSFDPSGRLLAHGYPACGSSDICLDRTRPVKAIVTLEQGAENTLSRLSVAAATRAIFAATLQYRWDAWEAERALELAARVAASVPALHLSCRPDRGAVEVVREYLCRGPTWDATYGRGN